MNILNLYLETLADRRIKAPPEMFEDPEFTRVFLGAVWMDTTIELRKRGALQFSDPIPTTSDEQGAGPLWDLVNELAEEQEEEDDEVLSSPVIGEQE